MRRFRSPLRFARSTEGAVAVEFALVIPILLIVYLMGGEIAIALSTDRKVENAAGIVGDLVTQAKSPTAKDIEGILRLSGPLMEPYDPSRLVVEMTAVWLDAKGKATVDCSRTNVAGGKAPHAKGSTFTLPASLKDMRERTVLVTQTRYVYEPLGGMVFDGAFELGETTYLNPRGGGRMTWGGC